MSKPTLYRVYIGPGWVSDPMDVVNDLIDEGVLVPVERCEHGNIDRHLVWTQLGATQGESSWCPGAGIGGDDGR